MFERVEDSDVWVLLEIPAHQRFVVIFQDPLERTGGCPFEGDVYLLYCTLVLQYRGKVGGRDSAGGNNIHGCHPGNELQKIVRAPLKGIGSIFLRRQFGFLSN